MSWFQRMKKGFKTSIRRDLSESIWSKCPNCGHATYKYAVKRSFWICPGCGYHMHISHKMYTEILVDDGSFEELDADITAADPLRFKDDKRYVDRLKASRKASELNEAIYTGTALMGGHPIALGVMDTGFIMGSLGGATGEKIARLIDRAIADRRTLILICQSGGARMQESAYSLMQMAKVSAKLNQLSLAGLVYVALLTDPTYGGVSASFGMLGDLIIAEPGARVGFAGQAVIKQFLATDDLPQEFQKAETVLEHGFIDCIVSRDEMAVTLTRLIAMLAPAAELSAEPEHKPILAV